MIAHFLHKFYTSLLYNENERRDIVFKVLLIEDDKDIRTIITKYFQKRDMRVIEAMDGHMGLSLIDETVDLVLLDIMMPGIDGYEVCYQIRQKYTCPIVFISALSEEDNQLKAFELGGDDYISKPFLPSILYAKCLAICKRQTNDLSHLYQFHDLAIDYMNHQVFLHKEELKLTHKEFLLLEYLIKNKNHLLSREQILNALWGYDYYGDGRAVDTYVKKLRKKLGTYQKYIHTVFKVGYMFKEDSYENED